MLSAARLEARKHFETNRGLAAGSDEYTKQVAHAQEVAKFLRENVVQGQAADAEANYSTSSSSCAASQLLINAAYQGSISMNIPSAETMRISRKEREIH